MYIPASINELLEERIKFCETVLSRQAEIPDCRNKKNMIDEFDSELKNFKEIKRLSDAIPLCTDYSEEYKTRNRFFKSASKMIYKMINHCRQQMEGVSDLLTIHQTLDLIEGLEKINLQVSDV
ncbi:MAG: hypothetical protein HYU69_11955 [Bacteroidetes bacterium]|nr:hypothetical protein [Bacteroidota bacterium]